MNLKLIESFIVGLEMHKFVCDCFGLSLVQGMQHLLFPFFMTLKIIDVSDTVFENIIALIIWLTAPIGLILCLIFLESLDHFFYIVQRIWITKS